MILTYALLMSLVATPRAQSTNINYQYESNVSYYGYNQTLGCPADDTKTYYIESTFNFTCKLNYNNENDYEVTECAFQLDANLYYTNINNQRVFDNNARVTYVSDFVLTPNQQVDPLIEINMKVGLDATTDQLFVQILDGDEVLRETRKNTEDTWDNYPTSYLEFNINAPAFYNDISNLCQNSNASYNNGYTTGYQTGYTTGYTEGSSQDETAVAIFSGIIEIALVPINFFLAMLNFEVFGINIGAFVSALLTVAIVVIIIRIVVSGGNKNG